MTKPMLFFCWFKVFLGLDSQSKISINVFLAKKIQHVHKAQSVKITAGASSEGTPRVVDLGAWPHLMVNPTLTASRSGDFFGTGCYFCPFKCQTFFCVPCCFTSAFWNIHWCLCSAKGMLHRWLYHLPGCPRQHTGWIWRLQQWSNITFYWNANVENNVSGPLSTNQVGAENPARCQPDNATNVFSSVFSHWDKPGSQGWKMKG